jgi:excisionase family DNA binding protein
MQARDVLSIKEVAERLGITPDTVRTWKHQGRLPFAYYKLGKRVLFRADEVEAWFQAQRVPTAKELAQAIDHERRS